MAHNVQVQQLLSGRGLWCGARTYTLVEWDQVCQQARRWGISVLHPKAGDGGLQWYPLVTLEAMKHVCDSYHLSCVPYWYSYGDTYQALVQEARLIAQVGSIFGAISPDIESQWDNQHEWATRFGHYLRTTYNYQGLCVPTIFANPEQHPTPLQEMNRWSDAFMPQVYFSEWTGVGQSATWAVSEIMVGQWGRVQQSLHEQGQVLVPLLPIISLGTQVPQAEIATWLRDTQHYGYCGFWYSNLYAGYAQTISASPVPTWVHVSQLSSTPTPTPTPTMTNQTNEDDSMPQYDQKLTVPQLASIWYSGTKGEAIPFNPEAAICQLWMKLINTHPDWSVGYPVTTEQPGEHSIEYTEHNERKTYHVSYVFIQFSGGYEIRWFKETGTTCIYRYN